MVCLRNMCMDTLHKGDNDYDNDDDDDVVVVVSIIIIVVVVVVICGPLLIETLCGA